MAEEEKIQAHAKKAVRSLTNKKKKWEERIKDFLYEIFIIIIAVSITLWFHNWNDKRQEHEQVKNFLIGERTNLIRDTLILNGNIKFMANGPIAYYDSVLKQMNENKIDAGYIDSNSNQLLNNSYLSFDNGLFQSFNSSGNLRLVENQKLLIEITNLYTSDLPFIQQANKELLDKRRNDFETYIGSKIGVDDNFNSNVSKIINQPEVKFQFQKNSLVLKELNRHYGELTNKIVSVIHEIDEELKDKFDYDVSDKK